MAPPLSILTDEARKRLKAIEEFADIGSGFNIAMKDLDIRGAGNILGAEQSGFISEIGFDMYHKILDEAIAELKESDFKDIYDEENKLDYVKETQIETDLELLITNEYIQNTTERLSLYKQLDSLETDEELTVFANQLIDRFGPLPNETKELIDAIILRRLAKETGLEKVILKQNKFIGYFINNQESPFYQSEHFNKVIAYIQMHPRLAQMRESKGKLSITFNNITKLSQALEIMRAINQ